MILELMVVEMRGLEPLTSCMRSTLSGWEPFIYQHFPAFFTSENPLFPLIWNHFRS